MNLGFLGCHHTIVCLDLIPFMVFIVFTIYGFMVILIDSECGSAQTTDAKYLEVCSGKNCNCTNTAINNVSVSCLQYVYDVLYCIVGNCGMEFNLAV